MFTKRITLLDIGICLLLLSKHAEGSSTNFMAMTGGQITGNVVASTEARSLLACAADCLAFHSDIFEYRAPMCNCYGGSSSGVSFVAAGTTSSLFGKTQV